MSDALRLGAHLSISQGLPKAVEMAVEIGANTFAYFTRNPRGGAARTIRPEEIAAFIEAKERTGVRDTVGHLPYTVNPAGKDRVAEFARMVLREDIERASAFTGEFLNFHPGSHQGDGSEEGVARLIATLQEVMPEAEGDAMLLLETMSGQGSEVGATFAQIRTVFDAVPDPRLGVCLDSCHLFAAGYDLRTPEGVARMVKELDEVVGLSRVRAMHLNDSKQPLGSHRDRHEKLGQGQIGRDGIQAILRNEFLRTLPIVLETPIDDYREYAGEIKIARELAG
ncbi:MAG: deoxyribonuclease IV [Thermaerobacter sp.]|nr:deoxyribonuclease IV [Thermaerobacter sp.]